MSIKTTIRINEGSTAGVKVKLYDANSDVVVPSSMAWWMKDSLGTVVASGAPSALSSETSIVFTNSQTLASSAEFKSELERILEIDGYYISSVFGAGSIASRDQNDLQTPPSRRPDP